MIIILFLYLLVYDIFSTRLNFFAETKLKISFMW